MRVRQKVTLAFSLLLLASLLGLRSWFALNDSAADWYSSRFFQPLASLIASLTGRLPFSLTELLVVLVLPLLILLASVRAWRRRRQPGRARRLVSLLLSFLILALNLLNLFLLLHGLNYQRTPLDRTLGLSIRPRTVQELEAAAGWLAEETQKSREAVSESEQGVAQLSQSKRATLALASDVFQTLDRLEGLSPSVRTRPKAVFLSHFWSYTGVSGLYSPFFVEANVNVDLPDFQLPFVALHELAHVNGFAREDEADFLAFLAGVQHSDPDYRYSALLATYIQVANRLHEEDREAWRVIRESLSEGVQRDLEALNHYWEQFSGSVQEQSTKINDAYLRANGVQDGVQSYGRMIDLVLACQEKWGSLGRGGQGEEELHGQA